METPVAKMRRDSSADDTHMQPFPSITLSRDIGAVRARKKPWMKLLYLNQPYPDNYTDDSFLSQLKRNTTVAKYSYWKLVNDFALISFHFCNMLLLILVFNGIYSRSWDPIWIMGGSSVISTVSYYAFRFIKPSEVENTPASKLPVSYESSGQISIFKSSLLIIFILLVMSPVLKSLTRSTSSDSIWALSFMLCFANSLFHDYAMDTSIDQYKPVLSTNLSFSNAIVLASRLNSTYQVFCFVLLAIQVNILLPLFDFSCRKYRANSFLHELLFTAVFLTVSYLIVDSWGLNALLVWYLLHLAVMFLLPAYFLFLQKYKNELQGPWDAANPIIKSD